MPYTVRVVGPSGCEYSITRGGLSSPKAGTVYDSPSAAWRAANLFADKHKHIRFVIDVQDVRDPERVVHA